MKPFMKRALTAARSFFTREDGSVAVETVIAIPMMFWTYMAMYSIFDTYRMHSLQQKVAYSVGDIISRQTTPVDNAFLTGLRDLSKYLSDIDTNSDISLRVTVVRWDADERVHKRDWSKEKGFRDNLSSQDVENLKEKLPVMSDNERLIVVETAAKYTPPFNIGLGDFTIENRVFTRPRYAPQVLWSDN